MVKRKKPTEVARLAAGEIELVAALWRSGPVTISEAHAALGKPIGYTTVQTRLNRLVAKGVVEKTAARPAKYRAVIEPADVNRSDLDTLVGQVNEGSVVPLVAHLVRDRKVSPAELRELKQLIEQAERQNRKDPLAGDDA